MSEDWIQTVKERVSLFIEVHYGASVERWLVFGSYGTDSFEPGESDLDLIVVLEEVPEDTTCFFISEDVKNHVGCEDLPVVGIDCVTVAQEEQNLVFDHFDNVRPLI